ncbi:MAG: undecaprenyl/decaprenyl-phosphate alpha-N-acetylglucosaminyl 1-phosphate transferase [Spirochaetales bacterium]|nr:undecaprenyl/decaprenyl-phosphate alpha-N-acetylglucosaminyl 1-phosphate transferase [Spirochaetales bacterium]
MILIFPYILASVFTTVLNVIAIILLLKLAHKFQWYDDVDHRKIHEGEIPRIGGVGISISFFAAVFFMPVFLGLLSEKIIISRPIVLFWSLLLGSIIVNLVGILDDFTNLRPLYKLIGQIAATLVIIFSGNYFTSFYIPFFDITLKSNFFGQIITFIWIIGITNAINLIDGMDGFSSSITALISLIMGIAAIVSGNYMQAFILFILFGSISGFFIFNFPPAKLFMGDSGSLFIGFILACIPLYSFNGELSSYTLILGISFLIIPILDTFAAIIRRKIRGVPFHTPDMDHLHHKLLAMNISERMIIFITGTVTLIVSGTALLFVIFRSNMFIYLQLFIWILMVIIFIILSHKTKNRP